LCVPALFDSGHLIAGGDDEQGVRDSVEATLEHCHTHNRQLVSEMRELLHMLFY